MPSFPAICEIKSCVYHQTNALAKEMTKLKSSLGSQRVLPYLVSLFAHRAIKARVKAVARGNFKCITFV